MKLVNKFLLGVVAILVLFASAANHVQAACSLGELPASSVSISSVLDKNLAFPNTISITNAPVEFRNRVLHFYITSQATIEPGNSPGGYFTSITIDGSGNGQTSFVISDYYPNLQNGAANVAVSDVPFNGQNSSCAPPISTTIIGEAACLDLGDSCAPGDPTPFCNPNAICGENGLVQLPPLSTFDYICVSPSPPVCRECEVSPDGTRVCGDLNPSRPVNCAAICGQEDLNATSFLVSRGCDEGEGRVNTAIGCVPFDVISQTAKFFLAWSLSVGGGVALLLVGISGFVFATSAGNPEKLKSAKDLFWAAISGLGMLLLSVFLLRAIGVDVLGLFG